jgi:hypothetical protein
VELLHAVFSELLFAAALNIEAIEKCPRFFYRFVG